MVRLSRQWLRCTRGDAPAFTDPASPFDRGKSFMAKSILWLHLFISCQGLHVEL